MVQLCLWAHDYRQQVPALPLEQIAALPQPFDLICWKPEGHGWSHTELTDRRFRIVAWPDLSADQCNALLGPEIPTHDALGRETSLLQYRYQHINLLHPDLVAKLPALAGWWADDTRAVPVFALPAGLAVAPYIVTKAPLVAP